MRRSTAERSAGAFLILGFLMVVAGGLAAPSGAYQGPIEERLAAIDADDAQWVLSKILDGAALAFMCAGGVLLVFGLSRRDWLGVVGGAALGAAGVVGLFYVYRLATDPGPLYDRDVPVLMAIVLVGLTAVGLLGLSLHLLRAGYSRWAAMTGVAAGAAALIGLSLILTLRPGPEPMFAVELVSCVGLLCIGIILARRRGRQGTRAALERPRAGGR